MWEIEAALIEDWIMSLPSEDYDLVFAAFEVLSSEGPALGRPLVDTNIPVAEKRYRDHLDELQRRQP